MSKMSNKQAYEALTAAHAHWGRRDDNHIYVWTSGYKCADHYNVEKFLMQAGMRMVSEEFDQICGKTQAVYKHKAA